MSAPENFQAALDSLTAIEASYDGLEVMSAIANQAYDSTGTLTDTIDVSYRIIGRPGVFVCSVPFYINWQAVAFFQLGLQAYEIEQIYEGKANAQDPPDSILFHQSTVPPTPIPRPGQLIAV